jgi:hypothetical protein
MEQQRVSGAALQKRDIVMNMDSCAVFENLLLRFLLWFAHVAPSLVGHDSRKPIKKGV